MLFNKVFGSHFCVATKPLVIFFVASRLRGPVVAGALSYDEFSDNKLLLKDDILVSADDILRGLVAPALEFRLVYIDAPVLVIAKAISALTLERRARVLAVFGRLLANGAKDAFCAMTSLLEALGISNDEVKEVISCSLTKRFTLYGCSPAVTHDLARGVVSSPELLKELKPKLAHLVMGNTDFVVTLKAMEKAMPKGLSIDTHFLQPSIRFCMLKVGATASLAELVAQQLTVDKFVAKSSSFAGFIIACMQGKNALEALYNVLKELAIEETLILEECSKPMLRARLLAIAQGRIFSRQPPW